MCKDGVLFVKHFSVAKAVRKHCCMRTTATPTTITTAVFPTPVESCCNVRTELSERDFFVNRSDGEWTSRVVSSCTKLASNKG